MKVQSPKTPVLPMKVMSPKTPKSHKSGRASSSSFVTPMKATRKTMLKLTPPKCTKGSQVVMKKPSGCQMVLKKPAAAKMSNKEKKARFENVMCKISSDWDEVKAHNKFWKSELENRGWTCTLKSKPRDWRKWNKTCAAAGPVGCYTDSDNE
ncbi:unnamed protein product [Cladocopium goreaui]|uniref:Uncharacterized protein n=1 Tax=Cladocopium goreaui TaxID=2562237 RepID=A0A9P1GLS0_9DINO|nr:unnamed protein product [Cladocopium goreaui]